MLEPLLAKIYEASDTETLATINRHRPKLEAAWSGQNLTYNDIDPQNTTFTLILAGLLTAKGGRTLILTSDWGLASECRKQIRLIGQILEVELADRVDVWSPHQRISTETYTLIIGYGLKVEDHFLGSGQKISQY